MLFASPSDSDFCVTRLCPSARTTRTKVNACIMTAGCIMPRIMSTPRIVAALVMTGLFAAAVHAQSRGDAASRIQRLEDRADIERLLLEYGRSLDARDFKAY